MAAGITVLLEETAYPQRLRLRLVQIGAAQNDVAFAPIDESEAVCEALVHVRTVPAEVAVAIAEPDAEPILLESWDTAALAPGDRPVLRIAAGSSVLVLIVLAV